MVFGPVALRLVATVISFFNSGESHMVERNFRFHTAYIY
jgi:hypothetical protein